ncbi:MAG: hypothetical protein CL610_12625 [Anaerolineaceae bacterium]|nr:hypothetical protein [Anaerolineaceae bacterium]
MNQPEKPNLDLINRVQQARMQHDAEAVPSQVTGVYWIEAKRSPQLDAPGPTAHAGYWQLGTTLDVVDELWAQVKAATESGRLGYKSKVATATRDSQSDSRVIQVLTYDSRDAADVERVGSALQVIVPSESWTYYTI